ncbi:unnamed protein product [Schistosoma haematobium]|nr:unnamed protein product [Schistosoma haematobium]
MDGLFPFIDTQNEKYGGYMAFDYCPVLLVQSDEHNKPNLCEQESEIRPVVFNEKAFQCPVDGGTLHIEQQVENGNIFIDIQCPKCTSLCKEYCPN